MTTARNWNERYANESFEDDSDIETIQNAYNNTANSYRNKLKKISQPIKGNPSVKRSTALPRSASSIKRNGPGRMLHYNTTDEETEIDVYQNKMIDIDTKSMNFESDIHSGSTSYRPLHTDTEYKNLDEFRLLHRNENVDSNTETEDDEDYKLIKQMEKKYKQNLQSKNVKSNESSTDDPDDDDDDVVAYEDDAVDDEDDAIDYEDEDIVDDEEAIDDEDTVDDDEEAVDDDEEAVDDDEETVGDEDEDLTDDGDINDDYVDNDDGDAALITDEDDNDDNLTARNDDSAGDNQLRGVNDENDDVDDAEYTGKRELGGGDAGTDEYGDYDYFDDNSDDEHDANTEEDHMNITSRPRENLNEQSKPKTEQCAAEAKQQNPDDNSEKSNISLETSKQSQENCFEQNLTLDAKIKSSVESMVEILHKSLQDVKLNEKDIILTNEMLQTNIFDNPKDIAMAMINAVKSTVLSNQPSTTNVALNEEANQNDTSKEAMPKDEDKTSSKDLSKASNLELCKGNDEVQHENQTNSQLESARSQPEYYDTEYDYDSPEMRYFNRYGTHNGSYYNNSFLHSTPEKKMPISPSLDKLKAKAHPRKSWSFSNERMREIERHNKILLHKILAQKPTYASPQTQKQHQINKPSQVTLGRVPSAAVNRKKQQRQIDLDNQVLKRKIEAISLRRPALPTI